jgi:hypothetical protein
MQSERETVKHLYVFYWRPDTFEKMLAPVMALCRKVIVSKDDLTCTMSECTCEGCRETFIENLPTGSGKVTTWEMAVAAQAERKRLADEANASRQATLNAAWTTGDPPNTWQPKPGPQADAWTSTPSEKTMMYPGGSPSKTDPYLAGIMKRIPKADKPPQPSDDGWTSQKDDGWKTK